MVTMHYLHEYSKWHTENIKNAFIYTFLLNLCFAIEGIEVQFSSADMRIVALIKCPQGPINHTTIIPHGHKLFTLLYTFSCHSNSLSNYPCRVV